MVFGQVLVGATLEKNKFWLPKFLGQQFWVVSWSSMYTGLPCLFPPHGRSFWDCRCIPANTFGIGLLLLMGPWAMLHVHIYAIICSTRTIYLIRETI